MKSLKHNALVQKIYGSLIHFMQAYFPVTRAKFGYYIAYHKRCDLKNPKTFSEKLLWLSLNEYRHNPMILKLCDKYLVREYVKRKVGSEVLNELYHVYEKTSEIDYDELPDSFAFKISQGCTTNLLCKDKHELGKEAFFQVINSWDLGQHLYNKVMADVGGIRAKDLKRYFICEKYLIQRGEASLIDYKIYCFNGVPKAILVISNRFENKTGLFMTPEWEVLSKLSGHYLAPEKAYTKPASLETMVNAAKKLSEGFPFVRVDMYDIEGQAVFGEMTFFPNGCIHPQETMINGKTMGELLDLSSVMEN